MWFYVFAYAGNSCVCGLASERVWFQNACGWPRTRPSSNMTPELIAKYQASFHGSRSRDQPNNTSQHASHGLAPAASLTLTQQNQQTRKPKRRTKAKRPSILLQASKQAGRQASKQTKRQAKQSKAKQSKAKQSKAKQSKQRKAGRQAGSQAS